EQTAFGACGGRALQRLLRPAALCHGSSKRRERMADAADVDSGSALRAGVRRCEGRVASYAGVPGRARRAVAVTRLGHTGPAVSPHSFRVRQSSGERPPLNCLNNLRVAGGGVQMSLNIPTQRERTGFTLIELLV